MGMVEDDYTAWANNRKNCWMRKIQVIFSSKENLDGYAYNLVLGDNDSQTASALNLGDIQSGYSYNEDGSNLSIRISGTKNLATLKDGGSIEIDNLSQDYLALIMAMKLFRIEIKCGYESLGDLFTIAKGEVSFITHKPNAYRDTVTTIMYASEYVASWTQQRITFSMNSGINTKTMLNYLLYKASDGSSAYKITDTLAKDVQNQIVSGFMTSASAIENTLNGCNGTYLIDTDSSDGTVISISDLDDEPVYLVTKENTSIANGNPTVTSSGLTIYLFPTQNLKPGYVLQLDADIQAMIDLSSGISDTSSAQQTFNSSYADVNGRYVIKEIDYTLENRGNDFIYRITAKAVSLITNITGVAS